MADYDSMGPSLQLVKVQFLNFLLRKLSRTTSTFMECQCYTNFRGPYFSNAWGYSHIVGL